MSSRPGHRPGIAWRGGDGLTKTSARSEGIEKLCGGPSLKDERGFMQPFNNNPQTPPNPQSIPDPRMEQIMERQRALELQNSQLRGQIDQMARQANPQPNQPPKPSAFQPEVEKAIGELVEGRLKAVSEQHRQQIGYLADQLDQAKFQAQYGGDKYAKFIPKVETLRQEYQAKNQYITREQALQMVHFEETGKKGMNPDPAPQAPVQLPPVYDRYLNQWVDPTTNQVVQPMPNFAPEEPAPVPPAQGWQAPPPQAPQTGMVAHPAARPPAGSNPGNPYGQNFQLPGQGVNSPAPAQNNANGGPRGPLSLESLDADLEAFENRFGDMPI